MKIYTDGSHLDKQNDGRLGVGGVLIDENGKKISEFSSELSKQYMKVSFGADKCSNPSAELTAVYHALLKFKKDLIGVDEVIVYADYIGVKSWMNGEWKIKEPYIQNIKNKIDYEIKKQGLQGKIRFEWVKGHNKGNDPDTYWNNYVDKLAKDE